MGKTRMSVLDVRVQALEMQRRLLGARVANVYDINARTYVLKLSVPPPRQPRQDHAVAEDNTGLATEADGCGHEGAAAALPAAQTTPVAAPGSGSDGWQKILLLIESGARIHTTKFEREHGTVPSGFCLKLRKHIRTRRLDQVRQLGNDRVIVLTFAGGGEVVAHLVVEFYAGGNIILTGPDYRVLTLLRTLRAREGASNVPDDRQGVTDANAAQPLDELKQRFLGVKDRYPIEEARPPELLTLGVVEHGVEHALRSAPPESSLEACPSRATRRKLRSSTEARKALASSMAFGPQVLEHALVRAGFKEDCSVFELQRDAGAAGRIFAGLQEVEAMLGLSVRVDETSGEEATSLDAIPAHAKGFVFMKRSEVAGKAVEAYDDFSPFLLAQYKDRMYKEFETFDDAVDSYFGNLEMDRAEAAKLKREAAAYKKVDKLAAELKGQVSALETTQESSEQKALAIESNIVEVDAALRVTQSAIAAAVDWDDLARMVEEEKKNGNPVAQIIHSLHLERNTITLMLEDSWGWADGDEENEDGECSEDDDDADEVDEHSDFSDGEGKRMQRFERSAASRKVLLVDVDLGLSAHANAREYYAIKKTAAVKKEKAVEATDRTIKAASKKAALEAKKMEADAAASAIRARRKPHWFEKFHWMVSSENYLIVAGRDAQQNELLVKRYMGPWDAYVHADVHGAASVVVKNQKRPGCAQHDAIPRLTLEQAGSFAMCRSSAWDAKVVTSAWWVRASQVSKTAPTGLSLATGSFVIRGKKNFLDPSQLVMGFAFLFKVDESCVARHRGERSIRGLSDELPQQPFRPAGLTKGASADDDGDDRDEDDVIIVGATGEEEGEEPHNEGTGNLPKADSSTEGRISGQGDTQEDHSGIVPDTGESALEKLSRVLTPVSGADSGVPDALAPDVDFSEMKGLTDVFVRHSSLGDAGIADVDAEQRQSSISPDDVDDQGLVTSLVTNSKYGLVALDEEPNDSAGEDEEPQEPKATKRRMSVKERRASKASATGVQQRMANPAAAPATELKPVFDTDAGSHNEPASNRSGVKNQVPQGPLPRGKRSKLKKIKKKYWDQDEDEREIALTVLGAKKVKEMEQMVNRPQTDMVESEAVDDSLPNRGRGRDGNEPEVARPPRQNRRQERKEVMRLMEEEGIEELGDLEKESLDVLDMLTANPHPDDIVQYALPICAPYSALTGYRYRAKLLPGSMKRGKAYRAVLVLFLKQAERDMRNHVQERDAMRSTPENDAVHMMLGNVRVMAPGLTEAQRGTQRYSPTPQNDAVYVIFGNVQVMAPGLTEGLRMLEGGCVK